MCVLVCMHMCMFTYICTHTFICVYILYTIYVVCAYIYIHNLYIYISTTWDPKRKG